MKKTLFSVLSLPVLASSAFVKTEVKSEADDGNVQVYSEARTVVNGEETVVISDQPGEIEIEATEEEVKIKTDPTITPKITINPVEKPAENIKITPLPIKFEKFWRRLNIIEIFKNFIQRKTKGRQID